MTTENLNFYGKNINQMNYDEKCLLSIDTRLITSYKMKLDGKTFKIEQEDLVLGTDKANKTLSSYKFDVMCKLLNINPFTTPNEEIHTRFEESEYSFGKFCREYKKLTENVSVSENDNVVLGMELSMN
jgi:hypothetical protein